MQLVFSVSAEVSVIHRASVGWRVGVLRASGGQFKEPAQRRLFSTKRGFEGTGRSLDVHRSG